VTEIIAMHSAEPVIFGVVKIVWKDGFAGIVDLRPILAKGEMFNFLRVNPARFDDLKLEDYGHRIYWLDDDNDEIDSARTPCVSARSDRPVFFISQVEHRRTRSCHMAEEIDLRFLGEQIRRLQGDVRQVKSDMAQMRTDVGGELVGLRGEISRVDGKLEAFRETVDDRFEQQVELIKSTFRSLSQEIATFRESVDGRFASVDGRFASVDGRFGSIDGRFESIDGRFDSIDGRFDSIDGRFEQQLELIKTGFATLSQEIATLKKS
jgi:archaellum component FlaC